MLYGNLFLASLISAKYSEHVFNMGCEPGLQRLSTAVCLFGSLTSAVSMPSSVAVATKLTKERQEQN